MIGKTTTKTESGHTTLDDVWTGLQDSYPETQQRGL